MGFECKEVRNNMSGGEAVISSFGRFYKHNYIILPIGDDTIDQYFFYC